MRVSVQRLENVSDYGPAYLRPHKDGGLVRYADHLVAVEVAHSAGMREALADFLTSIDEDDPVYMRGHSVGIHDGIEAGRAEALREARDAVAATLLHHHECDVFYSSNPTCDCVHGEVLAAIDALRGEP